MEVCMSTEQDKNPPRKPEAVGKYNEEVAVAGSEKKPRRSFRERFKAAKTWCYKNPWKAAGLAVATVGAGVAIGMTGGLAAVGVAVGVKGAIAAPVVGGAICGAAGRAGLMIVNRIRKTFRRRKANSASKMGDGVSEITAKAPVEQNVTVGKKVHVFKQPSFYNPGIPLSPPNTPNVQANNNKGNKVRGT
jgi:hypothetical protein